MQSAWLQQPHLIRLASVPRPPEEQCLEGRLLLGNEHPAWARSRPALLLFKKDQSGERTVNSYALGPVNEQLHSMNDPWLLWLRTPERYGVPFNSVQCNWPDGTSRVKPACDPYRVVAMVRLGAERCFGVGERRRNGGNSFKPYPMPHGSLLTFLSGGLAHRMLPDPMAGPCFSLAFRLTPPQTVASWHDKPTYSKSRAEHRKLYDAEGHRVPCGDCISADRGSQRPCDSHRGHASRQVAEGRQY